MFLQFYLLVTRHETEIERKRTTFYVKFLTIVFLRRSHYCMYIAVYLFFCPGSKNRIMIIILSGEQIAFIIVLVIKQGIAIVLIRFNNYYFYCNNYKWWLMLVLRKDSRKRWSSLSLSSLRWGTQHLKRVLVSNLLLHKWITHDCYALQKENLNSSRLYTYVVIYYLSLNFFCFHILQYCEIMWSRTILIITTKYYLPPCLFVCFFVGQVTYVVLPSSFYY